jgi:hypothetical protein
MWATGSSYLLKTVVNAKQPGSCGDTPLAEAGLDISGFGLRIADIRQDSPVAISD